jgi:hypothetical protein
VFSRTTAWIGLHFVPALVFPMIIHVAAPLTTADVMAVFIYLLLFVFLAFGQRTVLQGLTGWGSRTAIGLLGAWATGMVLLPVLDVLLRVPEIAAGIVAHSVCGGVLACVQAGSMPRALRRRWIAASAFASGIGTAIAFALYPAAWLPGLAPGAFPGRLELTTILRLLPVYGLMTAAVTSRLAKSCSERRVRS